MRDHCRDHNTLTDKLNHVIDGRILLAGIWVTDKILASDLPDDEKIAQLSGVLENEEYTASVHNQAVSHNTEQIDRREMVCQKNGQQ